MLHVDISSRVVDKQKGTVQAMARDITERRQAEELLSRTVAEYTAMIDTVPAMIYLEDINHHYVVANEAFCSTVGRKLDDIVGKTDGSSPVGSFHSIFSQT